MAEVGGMMIGTGSGHGEAPNGNPSGGRSKSLGKSGIPMKKKVWPKQPAKKLQVNVGWKKSFGVLSTKGSRKGKI